MFWTSGDVSPGFQSQGGFPRLHASSPTCNRFLRFITSATSADLLEDIIYPTPFAEYVRDQSWWIFCPKLLRRSQLVLWLDNIDRANLWFRKLAHIGRPHSISPHWQNRKGNHYILCGNMQKSWMDKKSTLFKSHSICHGCSQAKIKMLSLNRSSAINKF